MNSAEIKSKDSFVHLPTSKIYECFGTDEGYIWYEHPDFTELQKFEKGDCVKIWDEKPVAQVTPDNIYLERINNLMWETWGVKSKDFGRKEGEAIMNILNEWSINK